jgi:AraC-like DNA-binding protein
VVKRQEEKVVAANAARSSAPGADPAPSGLAPIDGIEEFVAAPYGRYIARPTFLIWVRSPELAGALIWGDLDQASMRDMMAVGAWVHRPDVSKRRRVLVDCSGVQRVDADVLLGFATLARDRVPIWSAGIERHAVVVPSGLGGILVGGALPSVGAAQPMRFTHDLEAAIAYVDHPLARASHELASAAATAARGRSALLFRLRSALGRALVTSTVETAAGALGMSVRTLQRELGRLGTSFSGELRSVRIGAAEALLVHSDLKIEAIATQVGFGTASRMSAILRRELEVTASELRARARAT